MTEHLPECWAKHESDPPAWCICDELRACEERVATAFNQVWERFSLDQFDAGYAAAVVASVQRIKALWTEDPSWDGTNWNNALHSALVTIDTHKESDD